MGAKYTYRKDRNYWFSPVLEVLETWPPGTDLLRIPHGMQHPWSCRSVLSVHLTVRTKANTKPVYLFGLEGYAERVEALVNAAAEANSGVVPESVMDTVCFTLEMTQ